MSHPGGIHTGHRFHFFVSTAGVFEADVQVRSLTGKSGFVNAKNVLSVLTLGVSQGQEIGISAEGQITELIENNFPDEQLPGRCPAGTLPDALLLFPGGYQPLFSLSRFSH